MNDKLYVICKRAMLRATEDFILVQLPDDLRMQVLKDKDEQKVKVDGYADVFVREVSQNLKQVEVFYSVMIESNPVDTREITSSFNLGSSYVKAMDEMREGIMASMAVPKPILMGTSSLLSMPTALQIQEAIDSSRQKSFVNGAMMPEQETERKRLIREEWEVFIKLDSVMQALVVEDKAKVRDMFGHDKDFVTKVIEEGDDVTITYNGGQGGTITRVLRGAARNPFVKLKVGDSVFLYEPEKSESVRGFMTSLPKWIQNMVIVDCNQRKAMGKIPKDAMLQKVLCPNGKDNVCTITYLIGNGQKYVVVRNQTKTLSTWHGNVEEEVCFNSSPFIKPNKSTTLAVAELAGSVDVVPCGKCGGKGTLFSFFNDRDEPCPKCGGKGRIEL